MEKAIAEKRAWLESLLERHERLEQACDAVIKVGAMDPEGPLFAAIWEAWEHLLKQCDPEDWISWFIHDNACGEKKLSALGGSNKEYVTIDSVEALARFLVEIENECAW
jgi:hypothetical protein